MALSIMGSISLGRSMVGVCIAGMMDLSMMENGKRTRLRDLEPTHGLMADSTKESG